MPIVSFDYAFPHVEKLCYTPSRPVPTPEVSGMLFEKAASGLEGPTYSVPEDFVAILTDVFYCPNNNVVMTQDGAIIRESISAGELEINPLPMRSVKEIAGYSALWRSRKYDYYHTLLDNAPRLLSLNAPPLRKLDPIKLLCPGQLSEAESFFLSRLRPDHVTIVSPNRDTLYRLEKFVFTPFKTRRFAGYVPRQYVEQFRTHLLPQRPSRRNNRIFVSREMAKKRRILNEADLLSALQPMGFEKVILEQLPLQEQIELFYDAEAVVAPHGAGLANLVFSPPCKVLELFPSAKVVPHYYYLSKSLGHCYAYLCGHEKRRHDCFEADLDQVLIQLGRMGVSDTRQRPHRTHSVATS